MAKVRYDDGVSLPLGLMALVVAVIFAATILYLAFVAYGGDAKEYAERLIGPFRKVRIRWSKPCQRA